MTCSRKMIFNKSGHGKEDGELTHSMVHYLMIIHQLKEEKGFARVTDIARNLNITKGSVSVALNGLKKKELVTEEDGCKFVVLTECGHNRVHDIITSRALLFDFLRGHLGVSEEVAERDSCSMEHLISSETREKFFKYMNRK